ncbi:hypothetical protein FEM48_Zijuj09G0092400 [Ziziphus jujuba var. spinosa]|uniref:inorganic diphosphatase n=1 Tax=Ziziphus jujuba var. spinosa TaxID=714518 RepID=A0A978US52_ZIZJJ|nr:hypothetical protein FEM48_Zijuj09G0092400 [Ziziphus jujuba var. spinosa]
MKSHHLDSFNTFKTHSHCPSMATARVMAIANTTATTSCLLSKSIHFLPKQGPFNPRACFTRRVPSLKKSFTCTAIYNPQVQVKEQGQPETLDYRVFFVDNSGKKISPWHDIPLHLGDGAFNFVVEIPKESSAKMEVATDEQYTPIKQDTKKGKLRYYPYNINWNYGLLPQTWEDPSFANSEVEGALGDNDPVDVVEIGERRRNIGEVLRVKPLGALAMIDEGELDWKIVAISLDDPKASLVNDVDDVEKHFPVRLFFSYPFFQFFPYSSFVMTFLAGGRGKGEGLILVGWKFIYLTGRITEKQCFTLLSFLGTLTAIRDWFRDYKIPDGKPANKFGLGNKAANKDYALKVITETNESWAKLVKRSVAGGELSLV